jgi:hypothetical protein
MAVANRSSRKRVTKEGTKGTAFQRSNVEERKRKEKNQDAVPVARMYDEKEGKRRRRGRESV